MGDVSDVSLGTQVRWVAPSYIRPMMSTDPESSETTVMLFHSFNNEHTDHMNRSLEPEEVIGCLRFEAATFLAAFRKLFAAKDDIIRCGDMPLPNEEDRIALCKNLLEEGLLEVVSNAAVDSKT